MLIFYLILLIFSAILLIIDLLLYHIEGVAHFGMHEHIFGVGKPLLFRLPEKYTKLIPFDTFFPENITNCIIFVFAFSMTGIIIYLNGFLSPFWFILPICGGLMTTFFIQYVLRGAYENIIKKNPKIDNLKENDILFGIEGYMSVESDKEGFLGICTFSYKDKEYKKNAVSVFGTYLPEFERVIILYSTDDCVFVESIREVHRDADEII